VALTNINFDEQNSQYMEHNIHQHHPGPVVDVAFLQAHSWGRSGIGNMRIIPRR